MAISRFYKDDACSYVTSTSLSVTAPASIQDGDLLVVGYFHRSGDNAIGVPSGWTDQGDQSNGSNSQYTGVATKVAVAADSEEEFTFTQPSSGRMGLHLSVYRGSVGDLAFSQIGTSGPTTGFKLDSPALTESEEFVVVSVISNVFASNDDLEPDLDSATDASWTMLNITSGGSGLNRLSVADGFYDNETTPLLRWQRVQVTSGAMGCAAIAITESAATGITGSGDLESDNSTSSGTGEITKTGDGTLSSDDSTMSGSGSVEGDITGEGDLFSGNSTISGTAEITKTGSGTLTSDDSTMSGSGNVGEAITGSGSLVSDDSTLSGTAERVITGSGTLQLDDSTLSGTGERVITAQVFDLFSGNSTMDGEAGKSINGSGDMESGDSSMDGGEEILDFGTLGAFLLVQNGLTGHIDDRLRQFLVAKGFTDDLHNYDLFDDYLLSLGFTDEALWDKYYDATKDGFLWTQGL